MEMKLELVIIPVTDVDRAKEFYQKVGFHADHDQRVNDQLRFVQMTPPGSACSIAFGQGIADMMKPGDVKGLQCVVKDVRKLREELVAKGVEVTGVDELAWGSFAVFHDPDGNAWSMQEPPQRK
jgi:predicted enzyme related to lactoylglutathione lyase